MAPLSPDLKIPFPAAGRGTNSDRIRSRNCDFRAEVFQISGRVEVILD
jgi:hypothetical protein